MPVKHAESYPRTPEALSEYNVKRGPEYLMEQPARAMRGARQKKRHERLAILAGR